MKYLLLAALFLNYALSIGCAFNGNHKPHWYFIDLSLSALVLKILFDERRAAKRRTVGKWEAGK